MTPRRQRKLVHEGQYVAEVEVEILDAPEGWAPYLSLEEVHRLEEVRDALRRGNLEAAAKLARVFRLTPINV
jgi:hypothetical protein